MSIANKLMIAVGMSTIIALICILSPQLTSKGLHAVRTQLSSYEKLQDEISVTQDLQLQVADVIQQTANGAQEAASAASLLDTHAEELHTMVTRFQL